MKEEKCNCSFCKLREINNETTKRHIKWLQEEIQKTIKRNQEDTLESIELCVKEKMKTLLSN